MPDRVTDCKSLDTLDATRGGSSHEHSPQRQRGNSKLKQTMTVAAAQIFQERGIWRINLPPKLPSEVGVSARGEDCGAIETNKGSKRAQKGLFGNNGGEDEELPRRGSRWLIYPQAERKILHLFQTRSAIFTRAALAGGRGGVRMNEGGVLAACKKFVPPLTDLPPLQQLAGISHTNLPLPRLCKHFLMEIVFGCSSYPFPWERQIFLGITSQTGTRFAGFCSCMMAYKLIVNKPFSFVALPASLNCKLVKPLRCPLFVVY